MSSSRSRRKRSKTSGDLDTSSPTAYVVLTDCFANQPSTSRMSTSPMKKKEEIQLNEMVHEFVYYVLIADQKKQAIKKTDILKHVLKENRKQFSHVKQLANKKLQKVFGFELVPLTEKPDHFILVNKCKVAVTEFGETQLLQRGLLFFVLTLIYMSGTFHISEEDLYKELETMGIDMAANKNQLFGDVKKYLTQDLVKQLYLEYQLVPSSNPPKHEFRWGFRAHKEVDAEEMLNFVSEIYGNESCNWTTQYRLIQVSQQTDQDV